MQVFAAMSERMGATEAMAHARRVESIGYDGLLVPEAVHDGLLVSMAALSATDRLRVATSVLVAFPRSPMTTALAAWDLQSLSRGRFELGLGSQVRANLVGRYSTPWVSPAPRMREYVESLRTIFDCFQTGEPLRYEGEHYRFDRLQPFFRPDPLDGAPPPIHLGAVGPKMTAIAGATADGVMSHPTNSTPRYLAEVTRPWIAEGAAGAGRRPEECALTASGFVATGPDEEAVAVSRERIREELSFLYSTPAYWDSLDSAGYGEVGRELHALARQGRWDEMAPCVRDEMLDSLVSIGTYDEIASTLVRGYRDLADRITFPVPEDPADDEAVAGVIAAIRHSGRPVRTDAPRSAGPAGRP